MKKEKTMKKLAFLSVFSFIAVSAFSLTSVQAKESTKKAQKNIVQTAVAAGSFKTLVKAVKAAGLAKALSGKGPFTVFAPTDKAFAKLPKKTLNALLKAPKKLAKILTYHVVSGKVLAKQVVTMNGKKVKTLNGKKVTIAVDKKGVQVNGAKVLKTDILTSNGVIHVIDTVILPPAK